MLSSVPLSTRYMLPTHHNIPILPPPRPLLQNITVHLLPLSFLFQTTPFPLPQTILNLSHLIPKFLPPLMTYSSTSQTSTFLETPLLPQSNLPLVQMSRTLFLASYLQQPS